jgi:hypothetical protein
MLPLASKTMVVICGDLLLKGQTNGACRHLAALRANSGDLVVRGQAPTKDDLEHLLLVAKLDSVLTLAVGGAPMPEIATRAVGYSEEK